MNGLAIMNLAHAIAIVAHDGQSRKGLGEPYIEHVERVADGVYGWHYKSVAFLHDVLEDTSITADNLVQIGIPRDIVAGVLVLTNRGHDTYSDFINYICEVGEPDLIKVKIADVEDNMRDIDSTDKPDLKKRYMKALVALTEALENDN